VPDEDDNAESTIAAPGARAATAASDLSLCAIATGDLSRETETLGCETMCSAVRGTVTRPPEDERERGNHRDGQFVRPASIGESKLDPWREGWEEEEIKRLV
jgi:hypothetical protein